MCQECRQTPCHPRCPNAEPECDLICSECKSGIMSGDRYYDSRKGPVCYECLTEKTVLELVELFEVDLEIAE